MHTPIRADLYPAKVTTNNTTHDPIKAIIGLDQLWLYTLTGTTGTLQEQHPIDHITGSTQHGYTITSGPNTIHITRSTNCGCGVNKTWKPFPYRITMTPIPRR